jgi:2-polyprenyl-6-methoxyphenol hydroxylase-like FAD-dependent oxidoreductase
LAERVIAGGVRIATLNVWISGARAARVSLERIGEGLSPYAFALVYPQDVHERMLIDELAALAVNVERRTELLRFEQDADGVRATLARPDGSEEVCQALYLAGCDGAASTVREQSRIGFPGGTYTGLFYVADVEATGPATDCQLHVDIEDADFVLVFPLKGQGRVRLVGTVRDLPGGEHGDLTFDDVKDKALRNLELHVLKVHWFSTYRVHHRAARRFRAGRVFLLGDAAHIHSPVGGQGMNTGIGDAVNLSWKIAAAAGGRAPERLLATYEQERMPFAHRLVATTDRAFTLVSAPGVLARFVRTRIVPRALPWVFRFTPLRRFMFRTLSQIGISYPNSQLSAGSAGAVRGGSRLPWVEIDAGRDNFGPLTSLTWQVHVYGDARRDIVDACAELHLPLHVFPWQQRMRRVGFKRSALYVVRPDGYVGLADPDADSIRLRRYCAEHINVDLHSQGAVPSPPRMTRL